MSCLRPSPLERVETSAVRIFFHFLFALSAVVLFVLLLICIAKSTRNIFLPYQREVLLKESGYRYRVDSPLNTTQSFRFQEATTVPGLVEALRKLTLWPTVGSCQKIPAVVFVSYPEKLQSQPTPLRKSLFFHTLLPTALVVYNEILHEQKYFEQIYVKLGPSAATLEFSPQFPDWKTALNDEEIQFIQYSTKKYRTQKAHELFVRIRPIPVSLILAQGALESSWGGSRFVREANNLFGIWTWKERGVIPLEREAGKTHKVAAYTSLIDSVRAYCLTLNRLGAYREFRRARRTSSDPFVLANQLLRYSERGEEYVDEVKQVMRVNKLSHFDTCTLDTSL